MKMPRVCANDSVVEQVQAGPGALNVIAHLAEAEASAFAGSYCAGLLVEHGTGAEECTLSVECPGGKAGHDTQITCTVFSPCSLCAT